MDTDVLKQLEQSLAPPKNADGESAHSRYTTNSQDHKHVLIHNAPFVFTCDKDNRITILKNHSIEINDDTITKVVPAETYSPSQYDMVYDAGKRGGTVVTPGLINTHAHPPMYLMRSAMMLDEGEGIEETISAMPRWERAMDEYESTIATIGDITEQQKYGITTTLSHYGAFYPIEYAAIMTGQHIINALSAASNTHPENSPELIETLIGKRSTFQSEVAASLHYLYKASPAVLNKLRSIVQAHNILFTCHLAESEFVARECVRVHNLSEVKVLKHHGLLNSNTIVSHVIHVDDEDIELLRKHRVPYSVTLSPTAAERCAT